MTKTHDETVTEIRNPALHYAAYSLVGPGFTRREPTYISTQFGALSLKKVRKPSILLVPSTFSETTEPEPPVSGAADHYLCYEAYLSIGQSTPKANITLDDPQSESSPGYVSNTDYRLDPRLLRYLCNPVIKNEEPSPEFEDITNHLACYAIKGRIRSATPNVADQFDNRSLRLRGERLLCAPAAKALSIPDENGPTGDQ